MLTFNWYIQSINFSPISQVAIIIYVLRLRFSKRTRHPNTHTQIHTRAHTHAQCVGCLTSVFLLPFSIEALTTFHHFVCFFFLLVSGTQLDSISVSLALHILPGISCWLNGRMNQWMHKWMVTFTILILHSLYNWSMSSQFRLLFQKCHWCPVLYRLLSALCRCSPTAPYSEPVLQTHLAPGLHWCGGKGLPRNR